MALDPDAGIEWEWNLEARTSAITYFLRSQASGAVSDRFRRREHDEGPD